MELVLLRHGKAANDHPDGDEARPLVAKGVKQARRAARLLREAGLLPELMLTSPLVRARRTAEEFCAEAGMPGPLTVGWLACGMDPESALAELAGFRDFKRLGIVGHEPDFSDFLQWCLCASGGSIEVKKGALACVEIRPPARYGRLLYLVPPGLLQDSPEPI